MPERKGTEGLPKVEVFKDEHGAPQIILLDGKKQNHVTSIGWGYEWQDGIAQVTLSFHADLIIYEHSDTVASTD